MVILDQDEGAEHTIAMHLIPLREIAGFDQVRTVEQASEVARAAAKAKSLMPCPARSEYRTYPDGSMENNEWLMYQMSIGHFHDMIWLIGETLYGWPRQPFPRHPMAEEYYRKVAVAVNAKLVAGIPIKGVSARARKK